MRINVSSLLTTLAATASFGLAPTLVHAAPDAVVAKASCALADRGASVATSAAEWPGLALVKGSTGSAVVVVTLGDRPGAPRATALRTSSGDASLDAEALHVAQSSDYTPARTACQAQPGEFLLRVDFPG